MAEIRQIAIPIQVTFSCDKCHGMDGKGSEMTFTGEKYPTTPPHYEHRCPCCQYRQTYTSIYPRTDYISRSEFQQDMKENPLTATDIFRNDIASSLIDSL